MVVNMRYHAYEGIVRAMMKEGPRILFGGSYSGICLCREGVPEISTVDHIGIAGPYDMIPSTSSGHHTSMGGGRTKPLGLGGHS